jgi:hypothetical protein
LKAELIRWSALPAPARPDRRDTRLVVTGGQRPRSEQRGEIDADLAVGSWHRLPEVRRDHRLGRAKKEELQIVSLNDRRSVRRQHRVVGRWIELEVSGVDHRGLSGCGQRHQRTQDDRERNVNNCSHRSASDR